MLVIFCLHSKCRVTWPDLTLGPSLTLLTSCLFPCFCFHLMLLILLHLFNLASCYHFLLRIIMRSFVDYFVCVDALKSSWFLVFWFWVVVSLVFPIFCPVVFSKTFLKTPIRLAFVQYLPVICLVVWNFLLYRHLFSFLRPLAPFRGHSKLCRNERQKWRPSHIFSLLRHWLSIGSGIRQSGTHLQVS